jgi:hypothetical protein
MANSKSFNLIQKELSLKQDIRAERDWFTLFNIIAICVAIAVSVGAFIFQNSLTTGLENTSQELANQINTDLNTRSRSIIKTKISALNNRLNLYNDVLIQNFDTADFYNELAGIYPNIHIDAFTAEPTATYISVSISIPTNGYTEIPDFLNALEKSEKLKNSQITSIAFKQKEGSKSQNISDFETLIKVNITREVKS